MSPEAGAAGTVRTAGPRALVGVLASVAASGLAWGTLMPLVPVLLEQQGVSETMIGLNSAMPVLAVLCVSWLMRPLLHRLGLDVALFGSLAVITLAVLAMHWLRGPGESLLLRFVAGFGGGLHWILSETWVNATARPERRGLVVGLYGTLYTSGFVIGPAMLAWLDLRGPGPFVLIAGAVAVTGLALAWARRDLPPIDPAGARPSWRAFAAAPVLFLGALAGGLVDGSAWSLFPVYLLAKGHSETMAFLLTAVLSAGIVSCQAPLGMLADRLGARPLLLASVAGTIVTGLLVPLLIDGGWPGYGVVFLLGAFTGVLYSAALTDLGVRFTGPALAGANGLFITIYSLGSAAGPPLAGAAMHGLGPQALIWFVVAVSAVYLALAVVLRDGVGGPSLPRSPGGS